MTNIKIGDILHIRARVKDFGDNWIEVERIYELNNNPSLIIAYSDVLEVEPRPLQPGDEVVSPAGVLHVVIGVDGGEVWTRDSNGRSYVYRTEELRRND